MQVRVQGDVADALIQRACLTLRHAATSKSRGCADRTVRMATGTSSTTTPKKSAYPSTWSTGSNIQLMAPKMSDTTDRSLFRRALLARFDTHGYTHQRGLRRPLFYKSGYLSCTKCNGLTFIDAAALRTILELRGVVDFGNIRPESLPACVGCGETAGLRVGAHDFLSLIEGDDARTKHSSGNSNFEFTAMVVFMNNTYSNRLTCDERLTVALLRCCDRS